MTGTETVHHEGTRSGQSGHGVARFTAVRDGGAILTVTRGRSGKRRALRRVASLICLDRSRQKLRFSKRVRRGRLVRADGEELAGVMEWQTYRT